MAKKKKFKIKSTVWLYPSATAAWHFVNVPKKESDEIKGSFGKMSRGWNSLPVTVTVGKTTWDTSIFYDRRQTAYILPLKAEVRKKECIYPEDPITLTIKLRV